jgi:hypothetical protein
MKIGIIGPNRVNNESVADRQEMLLKLAKIVAISGDEVVLTPDKDSLLEYFGHKYLEQGGKKIWLVIPQEDTEQEGFLNAEIGEVISCQSWDNQADEFNRQSDIFVCVGYAWGGLKEIACAQYFNKKKIYILNEFISSKLPEELNFLIEYISIDELSQKLN